MVTPGTGGGDRLSGERDRWVDRRLPDQETPLAVPARKAQNHRRDRDPRCGRSRVNDVKPAGAIVRDLVSEPAAALAAGRSAEAWPAAGPRTRGIPPQGRSYVSWLGSFPGRHLMLQPMLGR
jgi:hypothetical protein